jgi:DNA-binding winged helix-turn-helix (wHTH) protein/Tol biopolymer transport system component
MSLDQPTQTVISFGPFEANLQTQELKRQGVRLRLPRQSFQILAMLLQRPGQLIPREELQQALWPSDTFVDFEKGINAAINRLREALGDSAETPRYIETLPRRGYRFIAPVENPGAEVGQSGRSMALSGNAGWMVHFAPTKRLALLFSFVGLLALAPIVLRLNLQSPQPRVTDWVQITKDGLFKGDVNGRLLSDGTRLYFVELLPEGDALMQVSIHGGETARIPLALEWPVLYDISPTSSELLMGTFKAMDPEWPLWVMPLPAGPPHRVGDILAHDACWAPDGLHLAYLNDKDLFVAKPDGSEVRKLATTDGFTSSLRFSPDGTRLRFAVSHSTDTTVEDSDTIMEIGADGSGVHRLPIHGDNGTWSASGKYYFYATPRGIWVLPERRSIFGEVELGTSVQLTPRPMALYGLAPSADGTQLFVAGAQGKGQLLHYDSKSNQFVPFLGGISAWDTEVSPDGQWIAYLTFPDYNLWRSKLDGSDRLQLTFAPLIALEPHWSPDGKQILFAGGLSKIFVVPAEGGTPRQLMPADHPNIIGAGTWLPDGNSIVFVRVMGCPTDDSTCYREKEAIYVLNLKTQEVSKLPGSDKMFASRVSWDGRYVAAFTNDEEKLMLYDFQTERWTELAQGKGGDAMVWSHDSRFVYLNIKHGSPPSEVFRISIPDGKIERVLDLKDKTMTLGVWDGWTGLLPDDSLLLTFDKSTSDIHRLDIQFR